MSLRLLATLGLGLGLFFDASASETTTEVLPLIDSHDGSWTVTSIRNKTPYGTGHRYQGKSWGWEGINGPTEVDFYVYGPGHADLELGTFYLLPMTKRKESCAK